MMAAVKASSAPGRCLAQGKVELAANRDKVAANFGPVHGPLAKNCLVSSITRVPAERGMGRIHKKKRPHE